MLQAIARRLRRFRPRLVPTLVVLVLLPCLIGLGLWQFERGRAKAVLEARVQAMSEQSSVALSQALRDRDALHYRAVTVEGEFVPLLQHLLDNRLDHGRPGYEVLVPLRLASGDYLLVDRGWVAAAPDRRTHPQPAVPQGRVRLEGHLRPAPERGLYLGQGEAAPRANAVVQYVDMQALRRGLDGHLLDPVLYLSPASAHGFGPREWVIAAMPSSRHYGYSLQWFSLALALVVLYVLAQSRREPGGTS